MAVTNHGYARRSDSGGFCMDAIRAHECSTLKHICVCDTLLTVTSGCDGGTRSNSVLLHAIRLNQVESTLSTQFKDLAVIEK